MKKRTRLIAGVMAMMLTLGGCGSAANTANKKEATQTTAEQTASSQEDTAEAAAKETELDVLKIGLAALPTQLDPDRSIGIASIKLFYNIFDKNYEKYVLDFINNSSYFKKYGTFIHPISESNGECDAISEKYELDFKLFISQKEAKLRHKMADEIKENEDGTFKSLTHKNINQNENLSFYDLLNALLIDLLQ